jgi:DNA-binding response OmpR family regulator
VLVVEDDVALGRTIARALGRAGYRVTTANSVSEALKLRGPFRVGIFDIDIDGYSGSDLAQKLVQLARVAHPMFFTGLVDADALDEAERIGPVIRKADGAQALIEALQFLLRD